MNKKTKNVWNISHEEFMKNERNNLNVITQNFNYKAYITPYNEMRELLGKIVEEYQYLEKIINDLLFKAVSEGLYQGKKKFDFDKYIAAKEIIETLSNVIIEERIADSLKALISFRNYIIHKHYLNANRAEMEKIFPNYLHLIFEANDYITNKINSTKLGYIQIPNVYEITNDSK